MMSIWAASDQEKNEQRLEEAQAKQHQLKARSR